MNICFYFDNSLIKNVDCSEIEKGNPGVGGTEYLFISIPFFLKKKFGDKYDVFWLARNTENLPSLCHSIKINSLEDAVNKAKEIKCDIFIWRPLNDDNYETLNNPGFKLIAWEHNLPQRDKLNNLAKLNDLSRYICVSREHLDYIRWHPVYYKTNYIYNGINPDNYLSTKQKDDKLVVYMGALNSRKGFHILAKNWKGILRKIPDARLEVIGSGDLYDRKTDLGKYSIAEPDYEEKAIIPYLLDENLNILPSVKFHGTLGPEKNQIIARALAGIINPSKEIETFCLSAVEIQAAGTPVVSVAEGGLLETVVHNQTGLLGINEKQFVRYIIYLLRNPLKATEMGVKGRKFIKDNFSFDLIIPKWDQVLTEVFNNIPNKPVRMKRNIFYNKKVFLELDRILKSYVSFSPLKVYLKIKHAKNL